MSSPEASFTFGPGLIGVFLNVFLFGIVCLLAGHYFCKVAPTCNRNQHWLTAIAAFLLAAETANCVFDVVWLYGNLVDNFGNASALEKANWVIATDPALIAIVATTCQLFYASRMLRLMYGPWMYVSFSFVVVTAVISGGAGLATAVAIHHVPRYKDFPKFQAPVAVWLISAVVCDLTMSIVLSMFLRSRRSKGLLPDTAKLLNKLILLTIYCSAIPAAWATVDLLLYLFVPTGLHLAFNLPLGKLYTISFLIAQNQRPELNTLTIHDGTGRDVGQPEVTSPMTFARRSRAVTASVDLGFVLEPPAIRCQRCKSPVASQDGVPEPTKHQDDSDRSSSNDSGTSTVKAGDIASDAV